jgi:hypothetical protein
MDDDYRKIVEDFAAVAKELKDDKSIEALLRIGAYLEMMCASVKQLQDIIKKRGPQKETPKFTSHR